jgi:type III pantothenate kinase
VTPDVVVDVGNSRVKWGRVVPGGIGEMAAFPHDDAVGWKRGLAAWGKTGVVKWAIAGVHPVQVERFRSWAEARSTEIIEITTTLLVGDPSRFGLRVKVEEPDRVGVDRLLSALAAVVRTTALAPVVVINVGTAMTVDFVDAEGVFAGGGILPGPRLMARSLHEYTAKLPLIDARPVPPLLPWGSNTVEAIRLGIMSAVRGAADRLVRDWADGRPVPPRVFVTGGDCEYFRGVVFPASISGVEIDPTLTLDGIRIAAEALP